jgi:DNA-binding NtrC family response regulator
MPKQIDRVPEAGMDLLISHSWPGNIRELQNFIERSVILTPGNILRPPLASLKQAAQLEQPSTTLSDNERALISRTLKQTNRIIDAQERQRLVWA